MRNEGLLLAIGGMTLALLYTVVFGGAGATIAWLFDKNIWTGFWIGAALPLAYFVWVILMYFVFLYTITRR